MSTIDRLNAYIRRSATFKLLGVAVLALILLIPASMIDSLIRERQRLRNQAVTEISSTWGESQHLSGPVLQVPYVEPVTVTNSEGEEKTSLRRGNAYFLPDELKISASTDSEERYRGIYVAVLYTGTAEVKARFDSLRLDRLPTASDNLDWSKAVLTFGVTDLRGIDSLSGLRFGESRYAFEPGVPNLGIIENGFQAPLELSGPPRGVDLEFSLALRGSSALQFAPYAANTEVRLTSDWATPKFQGAFLPDVREVMADGFSASWKILEVNRPFAQEGTEAQRSQFGLQQGYEADEYTQTGPLSRRGQYSFGTRFLLAVDDYRKAERSAKYSALFIAATFLTFFFIEVLNRRRVHPVQYLLIGFGIVLFYVLLLSMSEHIGFEKSYAIAASLVLALIVGYSYAVLRNKKLTALVGGLLLILYAFFYSLLKLEDFSLLLGSFGLLLALATVMYMTRRVDWYHLGSDEVE